MFRRTTLLITLLLLAVAVVPAQTAAPDPYKAVTDRLSQMTNLRLNDWRYHDDNLPHAELAFDIDSWPSIQPRFWVPQRQPGDTTGRASAPNGWVCRWVELPRLVGGHDITGHRIRLALNADGDDRRARVFVNGSQVAYIENWGSVPILLTNSAKPGEKYFVAMLVQTTGAHEKVFTFSDAELLVDRADAAIDPATLRDEIAATQALVSADKNDQRTHAQQLDAAVNTIDFVALDRDDQPAFEASLQKAHELLQPLNAWMKSTYSIKAIGNAHIDMAWLWPWTETVEVTRNTYGTVLQLMRQYPDFRYAQSQARTYEWMEEKYPALFADIQKRVSEGRWEIVGGMWVEPDLNMPDGESFVRQLLVGQRYLQQKFGRQARIGWNPDSFGYNWQLPQLYKKAGIDYFITQKMSWNDTTQFPYKLFWWQSPDGSKLLTYFPRDYASGIDPRSMARVNAEWAQRTGTPEMLWLYGVGDHGGGPTREMLDTAVRWQNPQLAYPKFEFSTAQSFFDGLEKQLPGLNVPVWNNEMYFQKHRGVQTSQSLIKRWNRRNEALMLTTEKFTSISTLFGNPYPQEQLNDTWKKVLFNQFHDILPGSSIHTVYVEADRDHREAARSAREVLNTATASIIDRIDTRGAGTPVVVFNPLSWDRTGMFEIEARLPVNTTKVTVTSATGKPLLADVIGRNGSADKARIRVLATVPSIGYTVLHVAPVPHVRGANVGTSSAPKSTLVAKDTTLENEFLRVTVDAKSGCITSLFNKNANYEAIEKGGCGNLLQTFVDTPREYDAWDIDASFENKKWDLDQADSVELVENTPTRAAIRVKKHFQKSTFIQDITLYPGVARVDVHNNIDWQEKHILLKASFPLAAHNNKAAFEIPYGSIERPTTRNTPEEKAMFEVPALRWADLSDGNGGFSLLNDSKYGYDVKGNVLRLSLLRSPSWPDPHPTDEGHNEFTYSLYPHAGNWKQAATVRHGYELNYPVIAIDTFAHTGTLPAQKSFVKVDAPNVVLSSLKKAEDDNSLIIRLFEFEGKEQQVHITLPQPASKVTETNLLEADQNALTLAPGGTEILAPTKPYEIKSVKVTFAPTK